MSDTVTLDESVEDDGVIVPDHWLGYAPLFILDDPNEDVPALIDQIKPQYPVFYLLAEVAEHKGTITSYKDGKSETRPASSTYRPRLFKVVANLAGTSISAVEEGSVGLKDVDSKAWFSLPAVPWTLINDVEDFFREIHRLHGTEAIVVFTYDTSYKGTDDPSAGWGVVVPEQENSAGSCTYDEASVVEQMPDDTETIFKVGTAHSHPNMEAFCSGTDKADQAEFDGLHITYGWKYGRPVDYHIELQMGGAAWTLTPEQAFTETPPEKVDNPRIEPWVGQVTKKSYTATTSGKALGGGASYTGGGGLVKTRADFPGLPSNCPTPREVTLLVKPVLTSKELKDCPVCDKTLGQPALDRGRCNDCFAYLLLDGIDLDGLVDLRERGHHFVTEIDLSKHSPTKAIWQWEEKEGPGSTIIDEVNELWNPPNKPSWTPPSTVGGGSGKADGGATSASAYKVCAHCHGANPLDQYGCTACGNASYVAAPGVAARLCLQCSQVNRATAYECRVCFSLLEEVGLALNQEDLLELDGGTLDDEDLEQFRRAQQASIFTDEDDDFGGMYGGFLNPFR